MPVYLLGSNILSDMMRYPRGAAARAFERKAFEPDARMLTSIVVACEMRYLVTKKGSPSLAQRVDRALASVGLYRFPPEPTTLTQRCDPTWSAGGK